MSTTIRRILVVDDDPSIHEDFRKIFHGHAPQGSVFEAAGAGLSGTELGRNGIAYDLEFASQGQEAWEKVRAALVGRRTYAMAFIDIRMTPGWSGMETMSRIWEVAPELQVVLCTGPSTQGLSDFIKKVGRSGRFVVLKKPFEAIEVLQLANAFTEKWLLLNEVSARAHKLEESQHRYRFLAEATPGLLWTATATGNLDYLNQRWCDFTGMTVEQGRNWGWQVAIHPEDLPQCLQLWTQALRTGKDYEVEYRMRRASDGAYRWHLGRAMPMRNERGDILHWVGTCTDIDDKKRAETELLQAYENMEKRVTERTAELTNSERLLRTILDVLPQRVCWKDRAGRFLGANNQVLADSGMSDVVGKTDYDMPWREQADGFRADDEAVMKSGKAKLDIREPMTDSAGNTIWLSTSKVPLRDGAGEIFGVLGTFLDVTDLKRTEEKLHLQTLTLEVAASGIVITDVCGKILWVNPAFTSLTGYSAEEAIGQTTALLKSGAHGADFYKKLWMTVLAGKVWHGEMINRRKDGSTYFEEATITPVLDEGGAVKNFVAVKQNISQRKQNEEQLRAREETFRALADNVPDAVARMDRNLRFAYGNRALVCDLKVEAADFLGKTGKELNLPHHEFWEKQVLRVFETGAGHSFEFTVTGPVGVCYRESRLVPEWSSTGEVEFVLAVTRDVTEHKTAERERQMMDMQLRQAQKLEAVGQLASGIAHEINTPTQYVADNTRFLKDAFQDITNALLGYSSLVAAAKANAITPEMIKSAEETLVSTDLDYHCTQIPAAINETLEGVERVSKIVRAMKDFSHPGGREKTPTDLNKAIDSTVTVARNEWKYVAEMVLDLDLELPLVPCFVSEFNQAILNLVVNAAHTIGDVAHLNPAEKGRITVRTRRKKDCVEVSVSDTGNGIAEEHRQRIFEPFFTTKEVGKGTGQGLSLVYSSIVKKHGGTVTFETEVGKGTTFLMRLPIVSKGSGMVTQETLDGPAVPQAAASA